MKILGMGTPELLIILVVVLLIFGPKNLPKLGSAIGKSVKGLREGLGSNKKEVAEAADDDAAAVKETAELDDADEEPAEKPAKKRVVKKSVA